MTLYVKEEYVNEDKGCRFGDSGWYEAYTDKLGRLFRDMQREYGRCTGKVYVGDANPMQVGWVFQKRMQYEDAHRLAPHERCYIRTVWVTFSTTDPNPTPAPVLLTSPWEKDHANGTAKTRSASHVDHASR